MSTFICSNAWPKTDASRQYFLFATRLAELVHPKAQDIYRVQALSSIAKISELKTAAMGVLDRAFPKATLSPMIAEVNEALQSDPIVLLLSGEKDVEPIDLLFQDTQTTEDIISRCSLWQEILLANYMERCESEILLTIKDHQNKAKLLLLAKLYVAHLVFLGFHRSFIFQCVDTIFFEKDIGRCTKNLLRRFFKAFDGTSKEYCVVFEVPNLLADSLTRGFRVKAVTTSDEIRQSLGVELLDTPMVSGHSLVLFEGLKATDPFTAIKKLTAVVGLPRAFQVVYPSDTTSQIQDECWVVDTKEKSFTKVSQQNVLDPVHSYTSQTSHNVELFPKFANFAWAAVERDDYDILLRLGQSFDAAAAALAATNPQVQLVSIWSAFEALLPEPTRDERGVRIQHFSKLIAPCVAHKYLRGKYRIFIDDFDQHVSFDCKTLFDKKLSRNERPRRLAEILQTESDKRRKLFDVASESPLLCNRLFSLGKLSSDPSIASKKLENHEQRVNWQIHRIYRQRNQIVHSGKTSPFLPTLVENAFLYYRLVIRGLQSIHQNDSVYHTDTALQLLSVRYEKRKKLFGQINRVADIEDRNRKFLDAIFKD